MSASLRMKFGVLAAGLSCLLAGYAAAQPQEPATRRPEIGQANRPATQPGRQATQPAQRYTAQFRGTQPAATGQSQEIEHYLANCLQIKNHAEIEANEFAQQRAKNPEVKQFAQQMVEDHRQLEQKLQGLAGIQPSGRTSQSSGATGQIDTQRPQNGVSQTQFQSATDTSTSTPEGTPGANQNLASDRSGGQSGALNELLAIDRQITDRCSEMVREELQAKSGPEFDKCYLSTQVGAHVHMLAALEVIGQKAQGELRQVVTEAQPVVQQHLEQAKQLLKAQESGADSQNGAQAERQPTRTQR